MPTVCSLCQSICQSVNVCQCLSLLSCCQLVSGQVRSGRGISSCKSILLLHLDLCMIWHGTGLHLHRNLVIVINISFLRPDHAGCKIYDRFTSSKKVRQEKNRMPFETDASSDHHHRVSKRCTKHKQKKNIYPTINCRIKNVRFSRTQLHMLCVVCLTVRPPAAFPTSHLSRWRYYKWIASSGDVVCFRRSDAIPYLSCSSS